MRWSRLDGAVVAGSATRAAMRRGEVGGREVAPETGAVVAARWRGGCGLGDVRRDAAGVGVSGRELASEWIGEMSRGERD